MYTRLRKEADVQSVFVKGRSFCYKDICIRLMKNNRQESRFAFLCGKKNISLAVSRNAIRRRMREGILKMYPLLIPGMDIVLVFRGKREVSSKDVGKELESVLKTANLLKKNND